MKIRLNSFRLRLALSYVLIIVISFGLMAYFLNKHLKGGALEDIRRAVSFSLLFALGLAFMLGSLLAKSMVKPINKIIKISRKFASGDFTRRVYLDSKDELGELAQTLNSMAASLEHKIKEIEVQNQKLGAVLESMIEGIIVTDTDARITAANPSALKIFDLAEQDFRGKLFLEAVPNSDIAEVLKEALKKKEFIRRQLSLVWPYPKIFQVHATPIFTKGRISGCLLVIHDITELRRLENVRRDFVANVSHELKTPLTAIKGFIETLLEGALEDKENNRNFLGVIREQSQRLESLINDLLDLSYLESKEAGLDKEALHPQKLVEEILSGFASQLKKKLVILDNSLPSDLVLAVDKDKLTQVFTNLIDNAIKFNRPGGSIRVYSQDLGNTLKVSIEDSGSGIPAKDLPRIFERFYRVDKARSRQLGGTGLGLSIVKHIVELHGGTVGAESTEGYGSKFWFTLPK